MRIAKPTYTTKTVTLAKIDVAIENMLYNSFIHNFNICMWICLEMIDSHAFCNEIVPLFLSSMGAAILIHFWLSCQSDWRRQIWVYAARRKNYALYALGKHFGWNFSGGVADVVHYMIRSISCPQTTAVMTCVDRLSMVKGEKSFLINVV